MNSNDKANELALRKASTLQNLTDNPYGNFNLNSNSSVTENVKMLLDTLQQNKSFFKLLNYSLYSLKSLITIMSPNENALTSCLILKQHFMDIAADILQFNICEPEIVEKTLEIVYLLLKNDAILNRISKSNQIVTLFVSLQGDVKLLNVAKLMSKMELSVYYSNSSIYVVDSILILLNFLPQNDLKFDQIWETFQSILNSCCLDLGSLLSFDLIVEKHLLESSKRRSILIERKNDHIVLVQSLSNPKNRPQLEEMREKVLERVLSATLQFFGIDNCICYFDSTFLNSIIFILTYNPKDQVFTIIQDILSNATFHQTAKIVIEKQKSHLIEFSLRQRRILPSITFKILSTIIDPEEASMLLDKLSYSSSAALDTQSNDALGMSEDAFFKTNICNLLAYISKSSRAEMLGSDSLNIVIEAIVCEVKKEKSDIIFNIISLLKSQVENKVLDDSLNYVDLINICKVFNNLVESYHSAIKDFIYLVRLNPIPQEGSISQMQKSTSKAIMPTFLITHFKNNLIYSTAFVEEILSIRASFSQVINCGNECSEAEIVCFLNHSNVKEYFDFLIDCRHTKTPTSIEDNNQKVTVTQKNLPVKLISKGSISDEFSMGRLKEPLLEEIFELKLLVSGIMDNTAITQVDDQSLTNISRKMYSVLFKIVVSSQFGFNVFHEYFTMISKLISNQLFSNLFIDLLYVICYSIENSDFGDPESKVSLVYSLLTQACQSSSAVALVHMIDFIIKFPNLKVSGLLTGINQELQLQLLIVLVSNLRLIEAKNDEILIKFAFACLTKVFSKESNIECRISFFTSGIFFEMFNSLSEISNQYIIKESLVFLQLVRQDKEFATYFEDEYNFGQLCDILLTYHAKSFPIFTLYRELIDVITEQIKKDLFVDLAEKHRSLLSNFLAELKYLNENSIKLDTKHFGLCSSILKLLSSICLSANSFAETRCLLETDSFSLFFKLFSSEIEKVIVMAKQQFENHESGVNNIQFLNESFINNSLELLINNYKLLLALAHQIFELMEFSNEGIKLPVNQCNRNEEEEENILTNGIDDFEDELLDEVNFEEVQKNFQATVTVMKTVITKVLEHIKFEMPIAEKQEKNGSDIEKNEQSISEQSSTGVVNPCFIQFINTNKDLLADLVNTLISTVNKALRVSLADSRFDILISSSWISEVEREIRGSVIMNDCLESLTLLKLNHADLQNETSEADDDEKMMARTKKIVTMVVNEKDLTSNTCIHKINSKLEIVLNNSELSLQTKEYVKLLVFLNKRLPIEGKFISENLNIKKTLFILIEAFEFLSNPNKDTSNFGFYSRAFRRETTTSRSNFNTKKSNLILYDPLEDGGIHRFSVAKKHSIGSENKSILSSKLMRKVQFEESHSRTIDVQSLFVSSTKFFSFCATSGFIEKIKFAFDFFLYAFETICMTSNNPMLTKQQSKSDLMPNIKKEVLHDLTLIILSFASQDEIKTKKINDTISLVCLLSLFDEIIFDSSSLCLNFLRILFLKVFRSKEISGQESRLVELLIKLLYIYQSDGNLVHNVLQILIEFKSNHTILNLLVEMKFINNLNIICASSNSSTIYVNHIICIFEELLNFKDFCGDLVEDTSLLRTAISLFNLHDSDSIIRMLSAMTKVLKNNSKFSQLLWHSASYVTIFQTIFELCIEVKTMQAVLKGLLELLILVLINKNNFDQTQTGLMKQATVQIASHDKDSSSFTLKKSQTIYLKEAKPHPQTLIGQKSIVMLVKLFEENISKLSLISLFYKLFELLCSSNNQDIIPELIQLVNIFNSCFKLYKDNFFVINQVVSVMQSIYTWVEPWQQNYLLGIITNNIELFYGKNDFLTFLLDSINHMVRFKYENLINILVFTQKCLAAKMGEELIAKLESITYKVIKHKTALEEKEIVFEAVITLFEIAEKSTNKELISNFLKIISVVSKFYPNEIINNYLMFMCLTARKDHPKNLNALQCIEVTSNYFYADKNLDNEELCRILVKIFYDFVSENQQQYIKQAESLGQTLFNLSVKSSFIKVALIKMEFHLGLKQLLENDKFASFAALGYNVKGILQNLKEQKKENLVQQRNPKLKQMKIPIKKSEIKEDQKEFLTTPRKERIYFETGDSKELYISFDSKLEKIEVYDFLSKGDRIVISEMHVRDMERCVRSCVTEAFESNKGLFKRKPKAARCFSILQQKTLGKQRTIDVECSIEEDCIKYVDLTSILIQNSIIASQNK